MRGLIPPGVASGELERISAAMEYVLSTAAENDLWNLAESLSRDPHILRVEPFPGPPRPPTANDPGSGLRPIRVVISDSLDQEGLAA
jgi:hypothetical protein